MSEHHLPPNRSDWPDDPYKLLGVTDATDLRDLRRAYNRLIRQYKPESHPEEFQLVRAAYETLVRYAEWRQQVPEWESVAETPAAANVEVLQADDSSPARSSQPSASTETDEYWQLARGGDRQTAYRQLVKLHQRIPHVNDILLRLFWLLKLDRTLDTKRVPADWLVTGLMRSGLSGRLLMLYCGEMEADPDEALSERCLRLLKSSSDAARRAELLTKRWSLAPEFGKWELIKSDLFDERNKIEIDDSENWARLLFSAVDQLAWMRLDTAAQTVTRECVAELQNMADVNFSMDAEFQRLDLLLELTRNCHPKAVFVAPPEWLALLYESWNGTDVAIRPQVRHMLKMWVEDPTYTLSKLDGVYQHSVAAVYGLENLALRTGRSHYDFSFDEDEIALRQHLRQWLAENYWAGYTKLRERVLTFCLDEVVSIEMLLEAAIAEDTGLAPISDAIIQLLYEDRPLRCLVNGCNAFVS